MVTGPPGTSWRTWGTDAFLLAERSRRPVLLVLFNAWSPAWARLAGELARDAAGLAALAARAVLVAIESDLRPDITDRYALGRLPAAVVLTHRGLPLASCEATSLEALRRLLDGVEAEASGGQRAVTPPVEVVPAVSAFGVPPGHPAQAGGRAATSAWRSATLDVAASVDAALADVVTSEPRDSPGAVPAETVRGWVPEAVFACTAVPVGPAGPSWLAPLLAWVFGGPLWDGAAGACRRAIEGVVLDVRLLDDNARWLLALAVAGRAGALDQWSPRLSSLARWMAHQAVEGPPPGMRSWDAAPPGRPIHVEAVMRGARAWMQAAEALGDEAALGRAIDLFDAVAAAAFRQGAGVANVLAPIPVLRGLLATQVAAAAAALDASVVSGRDAYLDLADELLRHARAGSWREDSGLFVDREATSASAGDVGLLAEPRAPYETNLEAASALARLAELRREPLALGQARRIAAALASTALDSGTAGACWLAAAREIDRVAALFEPLESA